MFRVLRRGDCSWRYQCANSPHDARLGAPKVFLIGKYFYQISWLDFRLSLYVWFYDFSISWAHDTYWLLFLGGVLDGIAVLTCVNVVKKCIISTDTWCRNSVDGEGMSCYRGHLLQFKVEDGVFFPLYLVDVPPEYIKDTESPLYVLIMFRQSEYLCKIDTKIL